MLNGLTILIVEDEPTIALNLATAVEDIEGCPLGPVSTVAEGMALLQSETVAAAILDANLLDRDVTPLALALLAQAIPFVIHTGTGLPPMLAAAYPQLPVVLKPALCTTVLSALLQQVSPDRSKFLC